MPRRMHPDGVAALIAVMLVPSELSGEARDHFLDLTRERVLQLATQYYRINDCDFDNSADRRTSGVQNLAKLNRANLR